MATWAEQGGSDAKEPIPPCAYIVRRGQEPNFMTRSNILPWQEALANHPDKWRQLTDAAGVPLTELPPMGESGPVTEALAPHLVVRQLEEKQKAATQSDLQEVQIWGVFEALEDDDFKANGMPKVDVVRERTGLDLTGTQIKEHWLAFQRSRGVST